ncbi:hypothetical protein C7I55_13545 [Sphingomonas deserti]|uniref:Uncharacterized protein n=1 Tax=Allosphingosinicella deserti TaxID=2116704 RepID=A0A2P7QNS4_9SPHN|nr:hypothetical protein C7I55_13545 [Sphingomonas deserti]
MLYAALLPTLTALAYLAVKTVGDLRSRRFGFAAWGTLSCIGIMLPLAQVAWSISMAYSMGSSAA